MILLDVMLPGSNGFSVCGKIREISETPVFFITARVMEEDKLTGDKSRSRQEKHLGTGLYLANCIFQLHGLKLTIQSTENSVRVQVPK